MGYSFSPVSRRPGTPGSSGLSLQSNHPGEGAGHAVSAKGMGTMQRTLSWGPKHTAWCGWA